MNDILTFLSSINAIGRKPTKNTIVLLNSPLRKHNISVNLLLDALQLNAGNPKPKQHKINGRNAGYGYEFDYDTFIQHTYVNYPVSTLCDVCALISSNGERRDEESISEIFSNLDDEYGSRGSPEYLEWRDVILLRDKKCQCCGINKYLQVHHIFGYKKYPELRVNLDNGIVLCKWCHERYHSLYGRINPNPSTFSKYMSEFGIVRSD